MGGSSSSSRSSTTSTTTYLNDQSYNDNSVTTITALDGGAIDAAFDLSNNALMYYDKINRESLNLAERATKEALNFAENATKADGLETAENMTKYAYIGVGALALAYLMGGRK
jgi:fructosamine-3-kinase